jgi:hypothetical protein
VNRSDHTANTRWFKQAHYGAFMHFLPHDAASLALVERFDVEALAQQLVQMGAHYFVITLGQNSGYYIAPNAVYDRIAGYAPGERCSRRDLPLDLYRALKPHGIRLMLYLPAQTPNRDVQAQRAFGLAEGPQDQPIDTVFAARWAEVIREWSDRYGAKVAGWWFDGCYRHVHFNDAIGDIYAAAAKHGNPHSIVAFNPGVELIHYCSAEDYTAGETNDPFGLTPASDQLDGSQWHALTFLGASWGQRNTRFPADHWAAWVKSVVDHGGVVTLDMGPNYDPQSGPIGSLADAQVEQGKAIRAALKNGARRA